MYWILKGKRLLILLIALVLAVFGVYQLVRPYERKSPISAVVESSHKTGSAPSKKFIKWVEFNLPYAVLEKAYSYDVKSYQKAVKLNWVELLSFAAAKNGGTYSKKWLSDIDKLVVRLQQGEQIPSITADMKYFSYYREAYAAILDGFLGEYKKDGKTEYGLIAFCPIAKGFGYSHFDDFGHSRGYGYQRRHLGNDLFGSVGTPIVAVEGGIVEELGWNQYGGWRVGIRSHDSKRYYYYAHLRKGHPYNPKVKQGSAVKAGDVIGYLGMTGYSTNVDTNNMKRPHLHFGLQLIFDPSQKDGPNQIWVDVYDLVNLLQKNRSAVTRDEQSHDYYSLSQLNKN